MQRLAIRLGSSLITLLLLAQLFLPPYLEGRVADRLTENGGTAKVDLKAIPAVRLLAHRGDKVEITATGLDVDVVRDQEDVFGELDRFGDVFVYVKDSKAGPMDIDGLFMDRREKHKYRVILDGETSAADLGRYFAGTLGGIAGAIAGGGAKVPVNVRMTIDTSDGSARATDAEGTVAGFPTGPVALFIVNAVLASF